MATLRLNDEQKKLLKRYNALLMAVADEGIFWKAWYSQGDIDGADGPYPQGDNWYGRRNEVEPESEPAKFLTQIVEDYISSISGDIDSYAYDDDTTGSGDVIFEYNPQTMTFNIDIRYYTREGEDRETEKSFSEVSQDQPQWAFGDQSKRPYKKLNDDEFVQSIVDKNNGKTYFELSYNGYGDSGEIVEEDGINWENPVLELAYDVLDLYHSGWENNEGADGRIVIDLENKEIGLYHTSYYDAEQLDNLGELKLV